MRKHEVARLEDAVARVNALTLGFAPSVSVAHSYLANTHAQRLTLENSVSQQQQQWIIGLATTATSVVEIFGRRAKKKAPENVPPPIPPVPHPFDGPASEDGKPPVTR